MPNMTGGKAGYLFNPDKELAYSDLRLRRKEFGMIKGRVKLHVIGCHSYKWELIFGDICLGRFMEGTIREAHLKNMKYEDMFYKNKTTRLYRWIRREFIHCADPASEYCRVNKQGIKK